MKAAVCLLAGIVGVIVVAVLSRPIEPPQPASQPTLSSGIEISHFDPDVRPQDDLYRATNGRWLATTEIPADKSNYGAFTQLADAAEAQLRGIIEGLSARSGKIAGSVEQQVGDYYAAFMDEIAIEARGLAPIEAHWMQIDALADAAGLPALMAHLSRSGVSMPLEPWVHQDAEDPNRYTGDFYQAGLSLPNRDYYLIEDDTFAAIRAAYLRHLETTLKLAGIDDPGPAAAQILDLETRIAQIQWDKVELRDPVKRYNPYPRDKLSTLGANIDWPGFLDAVGYGRLGTVLISQPSYVEGLDALLGSVPLTQWQTWLRWKVLQAYADILPSAFVQADFAFFGTTLNGIRENRPRWKRGIAAVEGALGEAVGQIYVQRHFPPESKRRMEAMVQQLIRAYAIAIDQLSWMGADTRRAAQDKLSKFTYKIGYPDRWRDYSSLQVRADDVHGNRRRAAEFEYDRNIAKLGQPIDRHEWSMTPQTVNAYYNPEKNEIVFPAAILQPPFFNVDAEDAANYGGIGAVIGHEISHGFDDKGSQYDGDGRLRMWWTPEDRQRFEALGARLAAQYDRYEPLPGYTVNGRFTLGENIADLGGVTVAHQAYRLSLAGGAAPVIDGLTADQRFFKGWAQVWRRLSRKENLLNRLKTAPHSPSEFRCNGVVTNLPEFHEAFELKPGDGLYTAPQMRIKIW